MEVGFVESIEESIFVGEEHKEESDGCEECDDWLEGDEESSEVGCFYDICVLIS